MGLVWLVGGTQESVDLATAIAEQQIACLVTVATANAICMYPETPWLSVRAGRLTQAEGLQLARSHQVTAILDASHPYAVAVSQMAIAVAQTLALPYLRYERPTLQSSRQSSRHSSRSLTDSLQKVAAPDLTQLAQQPRQHQRDGVPAHNFSNTPQPNAAGLPAAHPVSSVPSALNPPQLNRVEYPTIPTLLESGILQGERVLLTLGYRMLPLFQSWQQQATLYARILPSQIALQTALDAGFTPNRLIALRPPISPALEQALWQQWQISLVVTKASGRAGGEATKQQVAAQLGVKLAAIARPVVQYPQQTSDFTTAVQFCGRWASKHSGR